MSLKDVTPSISCAFVGVCISQSLCLSIVNILFAWNISGPCGSMDILHLTKDLQVDCSNLIGFLFSEINSKFKYIQVWLVKFKYILI